jgi:hypothetical protein
MDVVRTINTCGLQPAGGRIVDVAPVGAHLAARDRAPRRPISSARSPNPASRATGPSSSAS